MEQIKLNKDISVNSHIDDPDRIKNGLYKYLTARVWGDVDLLGGFSEEQINEIIVKTIEEYGDDINYYVSVALENTANMFNQRTL